MRQIAAALLLSLTLAACGQGDDPGTPATTDAAPAAAASAGTDVAAASDPAAAAPEEAPLPSGDFRIVAVELGKAFDETGRIVKPQEVFAPGDAIHASVVGVGSSDGLTLSARWLAADGSVVAEAGQSLAPTTPVATRFGITQPTPWPVGDYRVEIAINGRVAETRAFAIQ